ncbi:MAG: hypothetical protein OXF01_12220 [Gemmatimonadetes bacterium]|nr:hypothetical protein [Gemmatimonadota bacterium]
MLDRVLAPVGVPAILLLPDGQEGALERGAADYLTQPFFADRSDGPHAASPAPGAPWADPPEPCRLRKLRIDYAARG